MSSLLEKARSSCGTTWKTFLTSHPSVSMLTETIHSTGLSLRSTSGSFSRFCLWVWSEVTASTFLLASSAEISSVAARKALELDGKTLARSYVTSHQQSEGLQLSISQVLVGKVIVVDLL